MTPRTIRGKKKRAHCITLQIQKKVIFSCADSQALSKKIHSRLIQSNANK